MWQKLAPIGLLAAVLGLLAASIGARAPTESGAISSASSVKGSGVSASVAKACLKGTALPLTGMCTNDPSLVKSADRNAGLVAPGCVWVWYEVATGTQFGMPIGLRFRAQDCAKAAPGYNVTPVFSGGDGHLYQTYGNWIADDLAKGQPADKGLSVVETRYAGGMNAYLVIESERAKLTGKDSAGCKIIPLSDEQDWPNRFELAPVGDYLAELNARNEPYDACGTYGVDNSVQFWELRDGFALFWRLGQELPFIDPRSVVLLGQRDGTTWTAF